MRFMTTENISPAVELLNVLTISRFNNFKNTVTGHIKLRILSPGERLEACRVHFSDILFESNKSLITSTFVIELFLSIKNFWESYALNLSSSAVFTSSW